MNKKARAEKDSLSKNINALQQDIGNLTKDNEGKLQKVTQDKKKLECSIFYRAVHTWKDF